MSIPIRNVYYLLCYAWDALEWTDAVDVSALGPHRVSDLFARVLVETTHGLIRRGLDRGYVPCSEELPGIKGRLDVSASLRRLSLIRAQAVCHYDDLIHDVLPNRIIRSALKLLSQVDELDARNRQALLDLVAKLQGVQEIRLDRSVFGRVVVHRNNRHYAFLMELCQLVRDSVLIEKSGGARFVDFSTQDGMEQLFERFVRTFFRREQTRFRVSAMRFPWQDVEAQPNHLLYLPQLKTDVVLSDAHRCIVIDAKYYASVLTKESSFSAKTVRSGHLFQIFAYIRNLAQKLDRPVEGMLLYARADEDVDFDYVIQGARIRVRTLDLTLPWEEIHANLLAVAA